MPNDPLFDPVPDGAGLKAKSSLAYAKLVATPTNASWSQVYNAGNLFACLSLTINDTSSLEEEDEPISLHSLGKDLLSILESEFFTLEDKNINTVKEALKTSISHVPTSVTVNLSLALFKESVLYVFIAGGGKIFMKREGKIGVLLEKPSHEKDIITASGFLHNNDTVVIETEQFANDISEQTISSALELALPNDIAEALSPQIHEKDDGGQAAIIIVYKGATDERYEATPVKEEPLTITDEKDELEELYAPEEEDPFMPSKSSKKQFLPKIPHISLPHLSFPHVSHRRKLFLSVAVILIALLVASIFLTRSKESKTKQHELFVSIYEPAQKNYDEGKALESLNSSLSRDDFLKAEKALKENQDKFEKDSSEAKQISELLAKVEAELGGNAGNANSTPLKEAGADASTVLSAEKANTTGLAFGADNSGTYFITDKAVVNASSKKELIKNDSAWEKPQAIAPYQGNFYILDQKTGVLKYTAGSDGFGKSSYFKKSPDLSKATSMAIDGSIWLLLSDGSIYKYTRGESDDFKIKGLDKAFSATSKLFTNLNIDNLYILDRGNGRIVKLAKDGSFQTQYANSIIQQAKDFDVSEKDKKIYVLSNDKVYELEMK